MRNFNDQIIFITGGASGLGLETARQLAARGAHVAIFNRSKMAAEAAVESILGARRDAHQRVISELADVANREQLTTAFAQAARVLGAPHLVIHMAGIGGLAPMQQMDLATFDDVIQTNLYGTRHVVEAALELLRGRRGQIVLTGSLGGFIPVYGYTAYGASKFAVVGFSQCLRYELKPHGIDVLSFCPGEVMTPALAAERATTPPAARALKYIGGTMNCKDAVRGLLVGISRNQALIIPGWRSKAVYWAARLTPLPLWNLVTDAIVAVALRRTPL